MIRSFSTHTILITGASSGIGRAFAREFASRGASLVLVARRRERLESLASELRDAFGVTVETIVCDLAEAEPGARLHQAVADRGIAVTGLINNAGFGTFGPLLAEDRARLRDEIAVDAMAPVDVTAAFLPDLLRAGADGLLINIASMAAYTPTPRMAVYGASKSFILSFTEALWAENRGRRLTVFALSPGATATEFNAVVGTEDATAGARQRTAENVVATAMRHLRRRDPGPSVVDGASNRIGAALSRFGTRRMNARLMARVTDPTRRGRPAR